MRVASSLDWTPLCYAIRVCGYRFMQTLCKESIQEPPRGNPLSAVAARS